MTRRVHISSLLQLGEIELDPSEAHHARDVLRLTQGTLVEVFDDAGHVGSGTIASCDARGVSVRIETIDASPQASAAVAAEWIVAAAVPKGERADWMVEKLSELGAAGFVPLHAARSVVLPKGTGKRDRWSRLAIESAKQSRRAGVMRIEEMLTPSELVECIASERATGICLSTSPDASAIMEILTGLASSKLYLLIGPEGGWTDDEIALFNSAGIRPAALTTTILRTETAAVAAVSVVACHHRHLLQSHTTHRQSPIA